MIAIAGAVVAGVAAAATAGILSLASSHRDRPEDATSSVAATASQDCAVCLSELVGAAGCSGDSEPSAVLVCVLPGCGHGFHDECIGRWLLLRPECPLCRCPAVTADSPLARKAVVPAVPLAEAAVPLAEAAPALSRPARIACGFGDGRVVWTRSPPVAL